MDMEEFFPLKGFETSHKINRLGVVVSLSRKVRIRYGYRVIPESVITPSKSKAGYLQYRISSFGKTKMIYAHILVMENFGPKKPNCMMTVNHEDGNKGNNNLHNLVWASKRSNQKHAYKTDLKKLTNRGLSGFGKFRPTVLTANQVKAIKADLREGLLSGYAIAKKYDTHPSNIYSIKNGKSWKSIE